MLPLACILLFACIPCTVALIYPCALRVVQVAVAVKRRAHEGRGAPPDPSKQLQRDWGEMTASMAQLHAKLDEMTRWQRRQLDTVQGALMTSRLKLGSQSHLLLHPGGGGVHADQI